MSNSVAVVTGASQGIGRATAIRLARDFSALVLIARSRANLDETAKAVKAAGANALVIDVDLGLPSAARTVVEQALGAFGRIDALLNIAGAVPQIDLFEMTDGRSRGLVEMGAVSRDKDQRGKITRQADRGGPADALTRTRDDSYRVRHHNAPCSRAWASVGIAAIDRERASPDLFIQPAMISPISSGESSWT